MGAEAEADGGDEGEGGVGGEGIWGDEGLIVMESVEF